MDKTRATGRWISYTSGAGGKDHLSPEDLAVVEDLAAARKQRQGWLLCEVHVRIYEHADADIYVSFPDDSVLGPRQRA
jgi:hypothetical protein